MSDENRGQRLEPASEPHRPAPVREAPPEVEMVIRSRRALLWAAFSAAGAYGTWRILNSGTLQEGLAPILRKNLEFNEALWTGLSNNARLSPTFPNALAREPRVNGRIGLASEIDLLDDAYRIHIDDPEDPEVSYLDLAQLREMPQVYVTTELRCVEGWSQIVRWQGVLLRDIVGHFYPTRFEIARYVYAETAEPKPPDRKYCVALDRASVLHPQSLVCLAMNGRPLTADHGGPVRLVVPVKYGFKSLKRLHRIGLSNALPRDYWRERGYDGYAGL